MELLNAPKQTALLPARGIALRLNNLTGMLLCAMTPKPPRRGRSATRNLYNWYLLKRSLKTWRQHNNGSF